MKRLLACLMAAVMVFAMGVPAFAADEDETGVTFKEVTGIYVDAAGDIYAVDHLSNLIMKEAKGSSEWTDFAGKLLPEDMLGEAAGGFLDSENAKALFNRPTDIEGFMNGLAVSDTANNLLRYIEGGSVKTLLGKEAKLSLPTALASDGKGTLYIADTGNDRVLSLTKDGKVATIVSGLSAPKGLAWDGKNLYIADTGNHRILKFDGKALSIIAGASADGGYIDGIGSKALFLNPTGLAYDKASKKLYVGDCGNNAIRVIEDGTVSTFVKADAKALDTFPADPADMVISDGKLYVADSDAGVVVLDLSAAAKSVSDFYDVPAKAWYYDAVSYAYTEGLFNGTAKGMFSPQASMTRGMFVTVIGRLYEKTYAGEIIGGDSKFSDVADSAYYAGAAAFAADNGLVNGIGGGLFAPNDNVTRGQMAAIIYSYAKLMKMDTTLSSAAKESFNAMPDADKAPSWAKDALIWAVGKGVIKGKDGKLAAGDTATRAEVAQILKNLSDVK